MSEAPSLLGRTLADRYRVDSLIARGGMAGVYRARDVRLERDVAIKVLAAPYATDPAFTERFLEEARAAASLSHPSLVHVYDSGTDGDAHYIVMELLDRHRSLADVIEARGSLPRDEVLRIGRELLAGLRLVHERGLVHCDVKPANVLLGDGPAKLIDFGIATAPHDGTDSATSIGSLRFMSPEQLAGRALTPASDLFSLAATLYLALTGRPAFEGTTPAAVAAAHAAGHVRPPSTIVEDIPARFETAILQGLRTDPESRFSTAAAMSRALEAADDEEVEARDADTTQVVAAARPPLGDAPSDRGYVPPPAQPAPPEPRHAPAPRRRQPATRPPRRGSAWGLIGTLLILGAAALVVVLVILPLLELGRQDSGGSQTPTPLPTADPAGQTVTVPDLVGRPTQEAIAAARDAGLDWTVRCNEDPSQPEGIIDQEPPAGTQVPRGSAFNLFSARIADCR